MKIKTSITLSDDVLGAVDLRVDRATNRSEFIEAAIRAYLAQLDKSERDAKDRAILDAVADRLNEEAADVLAYQIVP